MTDGMAAPTKDDHKKHKVIRRVVETEDGHHGGAWKVAYADFVTAMMAFFLLMWIINFVPDETRMGLTAYFSPSPSGIAPERSGSGSLFGGTTEHRVDGFARDTGENTIRRATPAMTPDAEDEREGERARPIAPGEDGPGDETERAPSVDARPDAVLPPGTQGEAFGATRRRATAIADVAQAAEEALRRELEKRENATFEAIAERIRQAIMEQSDLREFADRIRFEIEREGLRIHILDGDTRPMFPSASAIPNPWFAQLMTAMTPTLLALPNMISVSGHTDSLPFRAENRSNWDLSTDRAIATRRLLIRAGLPDRRIAHVSGFADRRPLDQANPAAPVNRRVSLLLLRQESHPTIR